MVISLADNDTLAQVKPLSFAKYIKLLQSLLDNINIQEEGKFFKFYTKDKTPLQIWPEYISSWESELVCLWIEILAFFINAEEWKDNYLLLDEPDIHLHPDLQVRLVDYLHSLMIEFSSKSVKIVIATHSTAFVWWLKEKADCKIYFVHDKEIGYVIDSVWEVEEDTANLLSTSFVTSI